MTMTVEFVDGIISGITAAIMFLFPASPEGDVVSIVGKNYAELLVPSYIGMMVAFLFYFRDTISREAATMLRGLPWPELRYVLFSSVITLILGLPLSRLTPAKNIGTAVNLFVALLIILLSANPKLPAKLGEIGRAFDERPTPVDGFLAGVAQGVSSIGGLSRSGLTVLLLAPSAYDPKDTVRFSFEIAPAYLLVRVLSMDWHPQSKLLGPVAFTSAFFTSLVGLWAIIKAAERLETGKFLFVYGLIGVILCLVEVVL